MARSFCRLICLDALRRWLPPPPDIGEQADGANAEEHDGRGFWNFDYPLCRQVVDRYQMPTGEFASALSGRRPSRVVQCQFGLLSE
jgi:hypothetical protein